MKTLQSEYINVNGSLLDPFFPLRHGDSQCYSRSFYAGSRMQTEVDIAHRVEQIVAEGARIIDVGAYSSRPNAENVSPGGGNGTFTHGVGHPEESAA